MNHIESLKHAFLALDDERLENLEWHRVNGTPICCGKAAWEFVWSGAG